MEPDEPIDPNEDSPVIDADDEEFDDEELGDEPPPRSPWVGRGLIAAALGLWGVVAWLRVGGEPRVQVRAAALVDDDDDGDVVDHAVDERRADAADRADEGDAQADDGSAEAEVALADDDDGAEAEAAGAGADSRSDEAPRVVDDTPRDPRERLEGKSWTESFKEPDKVAYKVKRGGSMKMIANLYKIFHHEIQALNPGVDLERELSPGTQVVVWRRPGDDFVSESVGYAGDGSLVGGVPMVDGPGRILRMEPWKSYATVHNIAVLDGILRQWGKRFPEDRPLLVGNMSAAKGGRLKPHSTHRSGRDVDLSYPQKIVPGEEEYNWREMDERNLDADRTWALLELLVESGEVELVLIDSKLQKLLYDHAIKTGRVAKGELGFWLEYPRRPGSVETIVRHHPGHVDHLHVRFKCQPSEGRCKSRDRE
ncbi:MAG: penicillin-insensitive murein endopeptidase [Myxococcales bacterium]|nr:penicillin-insensitive murein endopeptidase [Myxococcales bacterium]